MTTIDSALAAAAGPTQTTANSQSASAAASAASDFNSFLKLLTAQLKNQDPLSPIDSTQFVEQLASFSAVEQQIESNRLLTEMLNSQSLSGLEGAAQWIGKEVGAPSERIPFNGTPVDMQIPSSAAGAPLEIVISNSVGAVVHQASLNGSQSSYRWSGVDENGAPAPAGDYAVSINYEADGLVVDSKPPVVIAQVAEARLTDGALQLVLDNGVAIDPAAITVVRQPPAPAEAASDALAGDAEDQDALGLVADNALSSDE